MSGPLIVPQGLLESLSVHAKQKWQLEKERESTGEKENVEGEKMRKERSQQWHLRSARELSLKTETINPRAKILKENSIHTSDQT